MTAPDTEFILACLQKRCVEISTKSAEKPCDGLVAFQDGVSFFAQDIAKSLALMKCGVEAIQARFKFARMNYESQHGQGGVFAEEFIAVAEVAPNNTYTGNIEVRAQIVLKSLTSAAQPPKDGSHGKG